MGPERLRDELARGKGLLEDLTGALPSGYHRDLQHTKAPLLRVPADPRNAQAKRSYDGCSLWGGFEPEGVGFLKASGFWDNAVAVNTDPAHVKAGRQSALVKGRGKFRPIQFTTGVPHRLTAWVKAAADAEIKVELAGARIWKQARDGTPLVVEHRVGKGRVVFYGRRWRWLRKLSQVRLCSMDQATA